MSPCTCLLASGTCLSVMSPLLVNAAPSPKPSNSTHSKWQEAPELRNPLRSFEVWKKFFWAWNKGHAWLKPKLGLSLLKMFTIISNYFACINERITVCILVLFQNGPAARRAFSNFCSSVSKSGRTSTLDSLLPEFWCLLRRGLIPFWCIGDTSFLHRCKSCSVINGSFRTRLAALLTYIDLDNFS